MDHRTFLQSAVLASGALKSAFAADARPVRLAVIGPGSRGQSSAIFFAGLESVCRQYVMSANSVSPR